MATRIGPKKPVRVYLAQWREHLKLTQQQVGDRIAQGIDKANISRWETAKRIPSTEVLAAYAEALGIAVVDLYRRPSDRPSLDHMIERAPDAVKDQAIEIVRIILKKAS